ncbi:MULTISPECIES: hypothetical protein [unclassified Streptomyces]|uniref:hypothetical protein n=1 Tax=unclassified Streptomyces TaxID=2593676 RepID=UPI000373113C|nr:MULTISPECIES: hypothetical protein [unclassified Streptomyces]MYY01254.1 hypothetical protein [Streptomyces sp. SID4913]
MTAALRPAPGRVRYGAGGVFPRLLDVAGAVIPAVWIFVTGSQPILRARLERGARSG